MLCDHELRSVGSTLIHENLQPMFHGIGSAEVFNCDSCRFAYAVVRDVERPEIEPVVLCGHRNDGDIEGQLKWVSTGNLWGKS